MPAHAGAIGPAALRRVVEEADARVIAYEGLLAATLRQRHAGGGATAREYARRLIDALVDLDVAARALESHEAGPGVTP